MDRSERVRLSVRGARDDIDRLAPPAATGLAMVVYDEELEADGVVEWSSDENIWVARLTSELRPTTPL